MKSASRSPKQTKTYQKEKSGSTNGGDTSAKETNKNEKGLEKDSLATKQQNSSGANCGKEDSTKNSTLVKGSAGDGEKTDGESLAEEVPPSQHEKPLKSALKAVSRWEKSSESPAGQSETPAGLSRWEEVPASTSGAKTGIGRLGDESLTDLEKFLKNLKQTKKKQWIAEGKVKGS